MSAMKSLLLLFCIAFSFTGFSQQTYVPDDAFEQFLVDSGYDYVMDNYVNTAYISEIISLDIPSEGIADLTGIEDFAALNELYCFDNQLTSLDVSNNTALTHLLCENNQLISLDVSNNTALIQLFCNNNDLTSLDLSNNTALTIFQCYDNQLTSLDLSNNIALEWFTCHENQLTSLDVSNNSSLLGFSCNDNQLACLNVKNGNNTNFIGLYATNNPNLTCIEVDDAVYATENWQNDSLVYWQFDPQIYFNTYCFNSCSVGIEEQSNISSRQLLQIVDLMGRETPYKPNVPLIYIYDDGSTKRVFKIE